jgi:hypothetical protein
VSMTASTEARVDAASPAQPASRELSHPLRQPPMAACETQKPEDSMPPPPSESRRCPLELLPGSPAYADVGANLLA